MALSMLGLRVRVFDQGDARVGARELRGLLDAFDALVDVPLASDASSAAVAARDVAFLLEAGASPSGEGSVRLPRDRTAVLPVHELDGGFWQPLVGAGRSA